MSVEYRLNGTLLTNRVELVTADGFSTAAEQGVLGTGGVRIIDPAGSLTFKGFAPAKLRCK